MARISSAALMTAILAFKASAVTIGGVKADCPDGWTAAKPNESSKVYCCPGIARIEIDGGYCCINVPVSPTAISQLTFNGNGLTQPSCAATVSFKDSDYSSKVSSASSSVHSSTGTQGSGDSKPASNTAGTTTGSSSAAAATGSDGGDGTAGSSTTNSDNAAAMPTAEILGAVLAAAAAFAI